jgi:hypothetical protein
LINSSLSFGRNPIISAAINGIRPIVVSKLMRSSTKL